MTQGTLVATAALLSLVFASPSMAQSQCWKSTDSTKMYGYMGGCPAPARTARRPSRIDEKGTQANAMQASVLGGEGQCWKSTDSTKMYGYWNACK